jgi:hypothetical protein
MAGSVNCGRVATLLRALTQPTPCNRAKRLKLRLSSGAFAYRRDASASHLSIPLLTCRRCSTIISSGIACFQNRRTLMGTGRTAGKGCGSEATGEKWRRSARRRPHARATPRCFRCAFWRHYHHHPASILRPPTLLRVALVDSEPRAHEFVRQTFKAHANGWTLDSYCSPDSLLAALDRSSRLTPHASRVPPHVVLIEPHWPDLPGLQHVRRPSPARSSRGSSCSPPAPTATLLSSPSWPGPWAT